MRSRPSSGISPGSSGRESPVGRRRTVFGSPPPAGDIPVDATVHREAVTVILSDKGWIRAARGHGDQVGELRFKEGDRERLRLEAWTTDRLLILATDGKFFTLACDRLPAAEGVRRSSAPHARHG